MSSRGLAVGPILVDGGLNGSLVGSDVSALLIWQSRPHSSTSADTGPAVSALFQVLVTNDRGLNVLYLSTGEGHDSMEPHELADPYQTSKAVALADFDADGLTDIVLGNACEYIKCCCAD